MNSFVFTLIDNGKLADQISTLLPIVVTTVFDRWNKLVMVAKKYKHEESVVGRLLSANSGLNVYQGFFYSFAHKPFPDSFLYPF